MAVRQFTTRISSEVYDQVAARAAILKRSVNKEIEALLAWSLDRQSAADEGMLQKMRDYLDGTRRDVSKTAEALGLPNRP